MPAERAQAMADSNPNAPTPLSIWNEMNKAREVSRGIVEASDNSNLVHPVADFNKALEQTYTEESPQIAKGWKL